MNEKEIKKKLDSCVDFKEFFVVVYNYMSKYGAQGNKKLAEMVGNFDIKYGVQVISILKEFIYANVYFCKKQGNI
ncbi:hypothetical protein LIP36_07700 [Amedibacillus dolichus]|uniref:hypothetical protein n=1 Tax=Amedibacillus dolichus TaxID=31971 RepID=UPI001D026DAE|nr:hypothetical protein [Amedibacillus dolichus]MCB5373484.1 hypothetical protein [Amedibacillus dolichus]